MKVSCRFTLLALGVSTSLALLIPVSASGQSATTPPQSVPPQTTPQSAANAPVQTSAADEPYWAANYPEIVRISAMEGDVRVTRGRANEKVTGTVWEKAETDLPLEAGYSLATGDGQAEIELENASTFYLAPNSVLYLQDLSIYNGIPHTELALLSGSVDLHVKPYMRGEQFYLRTPTDTLLVHYGDRSSMRVTAYMDATAITTLEGGYMRLGSAPDSTAKLGLKTGQTIYIRDGQRIDFKDPNGANGFAAFDKWVADRFAQRTAAEAAVMKASGLSESIPGLAELNGTGTFFDCAPYGKCWEPNAPAEVEQPAANESAAVTRGHGETRQARPMLVRASFTPGAGFGQAAPGQSANNPKVSPKKPGRNAGAATPQTGWDPFWDFPCGPEGLYYRYLLAMRIDPTMVNGFNPLNPVGYSPYGYRWAVCHAGSWIRHGRRYAWVVGRNRHHHLPVHWVKSGRAVGYVPIHPRDVKGQRPLNLAHGMFKVGNKGGLVAERVKAGDVSDAKVLETEPREFMRPFLQPLATAPVPHMEGHMLNIGGGGTMKLAPVAVPLSFNAKSQTFMAENRVTVGNSTKTVVEPVGTFLARGGSSGGVAIIRGGNGFGGAASTSRNGGGGFGGAASASRVGGGGVSGASSASRGGGGGVSGGGGGGSVSSGGGSHGGGGVSSGGGGGGGSVSSGGSSGGSGASAGGGGHH